MLRKQGERKMKKLMALLTAALLLLIGAAATAEETIPRELVGTWRGTGKPKNGGPSIDLTVTIREDGSGEYVFIQNGSREANEILLSNEKDQRFTVSLSDTSALGSCEGTWRMEGDLLMLDITSTLPSGRKYAYTAECRKDQPVVLFGQNEITYPEKLEYPFLSDGYWHYGIRLDGEILPLPHDALIPVEDNKDNEILYPVTDILDYFGVAYFWNPEQFGTEFSTIVNGISVSRDPEDDKFMWFTNQQAGYGNTLIPREIDGVFYAPNYFFEHTISAVLTKLPKGKEEQMQYVNIVTGAAYEWGEGARGEAVMRWKKSYEITSPSFVENEPVFRQPMPRSGEIYHNTAYKGQKVTFHIRMDNLTGGEAALAKIYAKNGDLVSCLFFRESGTLTALLDAGTYTVKLGTGNEWYGMYQTFGPEGNYQVMLFDGEKTVTRLQNNHEYTLTINTSRVDPEADGVGSRDVEKGEF